mmetsp:Transcript_35923/g.82484  ORF Transcript_35923/g.82484 Transcript_35923/m.82484 type:complete len:210 (+) Transcript_35923:736-1365(+)
MSARPSPKFTASIVSSSSPSSLWLEPALLLLLLLPEASPFTGVSEVHGTSVAGVSGDATAAPFSSTSTKVVVSSESPLNGLPASNSAAMAPRRTSPNFPSARLTLAGVRFVMSPIGARFFGACIAGRSASVSEPEHNDVLDDSVPGTNSGAFADMELSLNAHLDMLCSKTWSDPGVDDKISKASNASVLVGHANLSALPLLSILTQSNC